MRRLQVTRRSVTGALADYDAAWNRVRALVHGLAANAWRFRHVNDDTRWIEFIEWTGNGPPWLQPDLAHALAELDDVGPAETEVWVESYEAENGEPER
jgi:hypothetical protein